MSLSLLTVIPSGNRELSAQVETWEDLKDLAGLPGPLPAAPRAPPDLVAGSSHTAQETRAHGLLSAAFAGCAGHVMRPSGGFVGRRRCALRPGAGLTNAVVEPGRLNFLRRVWPPSYIWLQLAQRPFQMPTCGLGSSHPPREGDADLFLCILQTRSPGVVEFS